MTFKALILKLIADGTKHGRHKSWNKSTFIDVCQEDGFIYLTTSSERSAITNKELVSFITLTDMWEVHDKPFVRFGDLKHGARFGIAESQPDAYIKYGKYAVSTLSFDIDPFLIDKKAAVFIRRNA